MTGKGKFAKLAALLTAAALMLAVSPGSSYIMNSAAVAEEAAASGESFPQAENEEAALPAAEEETAPEADEEEASPETEEEPAPQAPAEAIPQAAEEPAPSAEEPAPAKEEPVPPAVETPVPQAAEEVCEEAGSDPEPVKEENPEALPEEPVADTEQDTEAPADEEMLVILEDGDAGTVSEELLEPFNDPELFEQAESAGTAEIRLKNEGMLSFGDEIILKAEVRDAGPDCRLVWEANDSDGCGWYTVGSGDEYRFILDKDNAEREYRVVVFSAG